jgi:hypothetical protein
MRSERRGLSHWIGLMAFWLSLLFVTAIIVQ